MLKPLRMTAATVLAASTALYGVGTANAADKEPDTTTPIKHVVVLFSENISFDHYFATYPKAENKEGEKLQGNSKPAPKFEAKPDTPAQIDTLDQAKLNGEANPNQIKPFRLSPEQGVTCSQNHEYQAEQEAYNDGKMDQFTKTAAKDNCASTSKNMADIPGSNMGYYDGNTVQGMWNYAQHFALSDNHFGTQFGPSTPGAINLISGNTSPTLMHDPKTGNQVADTQNKELGGFRKDKFGRDVATTIADPDPAFDDCSNKSGSASDTVASIDAPNVGDQLNKKELSWGWFQGGFRPSEPATDNSRARCGDGHNNVAGNNQVDYNPHHQPFQYFASTANPHHTAPASDDEIGKNGPANHQYDLKDFDTAVEKGNLPAVSYLKAGNYEDGHPGNSSPQDEQRFLTRYINKIQNSKEWDSTAIIIAYDDSDGWYDHKAPKILNGSNDPSIDAEICLNAAKQVGVADDVNGRCGPGTRHPLLVLSPYAKANHVSHEMTEQTSILRFIQDNFKLGRLGNGAFDERAKGLDDMFDFSPNAKRNEKLFLNTDDGTVAASYDQARLEKVEPQKVDLKPVAEGQNDPKIQEPRPEDSKFVNVADVKKQDNDNKETTKEESKSNNWWMWVIGALVLLGLLAALLASMRGKKKVLPAEHVAEVERPIGRVDTTKDKTTGAATDETISGKARREDDIRKDPRKD